MPTQPKTVIEPDDFESWRDNAVTQAFFQHLKDVKEMAHQRWIGLLSDKVSLDPVATQLVQVELKAKLEFIDDVLGIELADIAEAKHDGSEAQGSRNA